MRNRMGRSLFAAGVVLVPALAVAQFAPSRGELSRAVFHDSMRKLWEDHVTWTRLYIVSAVAGLPDTKPTTDRLLQNQKDIGDAAAEFYGREAGDKLTGLLRDHILQAAELVTAAKAGDQAKVAATKKQWYDNAEDIAEFLAKANPKNWTKAALQTAMNAHLDQTLDEATHRIQGKYDEDIRDYERVVTHILALADTLSEGIMAQFPDKFSVKAN